MAGHEEKRLGDAHGRDIILAAVREGLRKARPPLQALANSASHAPPPYVHPPAADMVAQFVGELEHLEARVYRCAEASMAHDAIRNIFAKERAEVVIAWDEAEVGLSGLDPLIASLGIRRVPSDTRSSAEATRPENPAHARTDAADRPPGVGRKIALQELATAQVGITGVDIAIAESGTLLIAGGGRRGRLASLLAPVHIAVVSESQIVRGLGEALARLRERHGPDLMELRSHVTCITGPSRTADIELTLTLGVHGPRELHVVLLV